MSYVSVGKLEDDILEKMQVREPVSFPDSHSLRFHTAMMKAGGVRGWMREISVVWYCILYTHRKFMNRGQDTDKHA